MVSGYKSIISNNNLVFEFRVFHSLGRKALNEIFDIFITLAFANQPESAIQVKVPFPTLGIGAGIFFTCVNLCEAKSKCSMQTDFKAPEFRNIKHLPTQIHQHQTSACNEQFQIYQKPHLTQICCRQ